MHVRPARRGRASRGHIRPWRPSSFVQHFIFLPCRGHAAAAGMACRALAKFAKFGKFGKSMRDGPGRAASRVPTAPYHDRHLPSLRAGSVRCSAGYVPAMPGRTVAGGRRPDAMHGHALPRGTLRRAGHGRASRGSVPSVRARAGPAPGRYGRMRAVPGRHGRGGRGAYHVRRGRAMRARHERTHGTDAARAPAVRGVPRRALQRSSRAGAVPALPVRSVAASHGPAELRAPAIVRQGALPIDTHLRKSPQAQPADTPIPRADTPIPRGTPMAHETALALTWH